jgi:hypothetical protein
VHLRRVVPSELVRPLRRVGTEPVGWSTSRTATNACARQSVLCERCLASAKAGTRENQVTSGNRGPMTLRPRAPMPVNRVSTPESQMVWS